MTRSNVVIRYPSAVREAGTFVAMWPVEEQDEMVAQCVQYFGFNSWEESAMRAAKAAAWDGTAPEDSMEVGLRSFTVLQAALFIHQAVTPNVTERRELWGYFRFFEDALAEAFELEPEDLTSAFMIAEQFRAYPQGRWPMLATEAWDAT